MTTALEVTTGEPALEDEGIPGGPGVYSTRCPPLPRLRMRESRDIVHRAVLRAKGIDPDLVPSPSSSSAASKPADRADGPSHLPAIALAASDPTPLDRSEIESLLPKSRRAGGGGGGDFESGAGADRHLRVAHEVAAVRRERRRVLRDAARDLEDARFSPRANAIGHGRGGHGPGGDDSYSNERRLALYAPLDGAGSRADGSEPSSSRSPAAVHVAAAADARAAAKTAARDRRVVAAEREVRRLADAVNAARGAGGGSNPTSRARASIAIASSPNPRARQSPPPRAPPRSTASATRTPRVATRCTRRRNAVGRTRKSPIGFARAREPP